MALIAIKGSRGQEKKLKSGSREKREGPRLGLPEIYLLVFSSFGVQREISWERTGCICVRFRIVALAWNAETKFISHPPFCPWKRGGKEERNAISISGLKMDLYSAGGWKITAPGDAWNCMRSLLYSLIFSFVSFQVLGKVVYLPNVESY